jgi:hypothetical protein
MFSLVYDTENSAGLLASNFDLDEVSYEYYDIYLDDKPIYSSEDDDYYVLSLSVNIKYKYIEIINASEYVFHQIKENKSEIYELIISLLDELKLRDYRIHVYNNTYNHSEIMTNELANAIYDNDKAFQIIYMN